MSNFFQVNSRDINADWQSKRDLAIIDEDEVLIQAISFVLFMDTNDIYFGSGRELGLPSSLFEFISDIGDQIPLREIKSRLSELDKRLDLDTGASKITPIGDEYQMNLSILINGRTRVLSRRLRLE